MIRAIIHTSERTDYNEIRELLNLSIQPTDYIITRDCDLLIIKYAVERKLKFQIFRLDPDLKSRGESKRLKELKEHSDELIEV